MQLLKWLWEPDILVHDPVISWMVSIQKGAMPKAEVKGKTTIPTDCMLSSYFLTQAPNPPFLFL